MVFNLFKKGNGSPDPNKGAGKVAPTVAEPEAVPRAGTSDLSELLKYMVVRLVDNPDEVEINEIDGERATILELKVNESDIGKVIGKKGRIIKSLRIVLRAASVHDGKSVSIELAKDDKEDAEPA